MGTPWDNGEMFEWYLYDYLMKNGRGEIAEIFRREANLPFDPMSPPAIDVPHGFLHEWWSITHDILKAWQQKNSDNNGGCSYTEMNEEMIRELTASSDLELTTWDYLMPLVSQTQETSLIAQGVRSPNCETLEAEKVEPNESGRKSKTSAGFEYGSNRVPVTMDCPSKTSSRVCKSFDDTGKISHSHYSGNKDDRKTSSSNSQTNHATAEC